MHPRRDTFDKPSTLGLTWEPDPSLAVHSRGSWITALLFLVPGTILLLLYIYTNKYIFVRKIVIFLNKYGYNNIFTNINLVASWLFSSFRGRRAQGGSTQCAFGLVSRNQTPRPVAWCTRRIPLPPDTPPPAPWPAGDHHPTHGAACPCGRLDSEHSRLTVRFGPPGALLKIGDCFIFKRKTLVLKSQVFFSYPPNEVVFLIITRAKVEFCVNFVNGVGPVVVVSKSFEQKCRCVCAFYAFVWVS